MFCSPPPAPRIFHDGYTFTEGFYWVCITATTIGFGDLHPVDSAGYWFAIFYQPLIVMSFTMWAFSVTQGTCIWTCDSYVGHFLAIASPRTAHPHRPRRVPPCASYHPWLWRLTRFLFAWLALAIQWHILAPQFTCFVGHQGLDPGKGRINKLLKHKTLNTAM